MTEKFFKTGENGIGKEGSSERAPQRAERALGDAQREIHEKVVAYETPFPHVTDLPDEGVAQLNADVAWLNSVDYREGTTFESELPTVLATVSPEEWDFLSRVQLSDETVITDEAGDHIYLDFRDPSHQEDIAHLRSGLPELWGTVESDLQKFSPSAKWRLIKFDRVYTEAGGTPRFGADMWHSDGAKLPHYVISGDTIMTECYKGEASMRYRSTNVAVDPDVQPLSAPARGVLRLGPKNIHRTPPEVSEGGDRIFITFVPEKKS